LESKVLEADPSASLSQSSHAWIDETGSVVEVIRDGDLAAAGANSLSRYLRSVGANRNNIGANSVIRRSCLDDLWFTEVVGTDRILLSHLAYRGRFINHSDVLYQRRTFKMTEPSRWNTYMVRLTGTQNATTDWVSFARASCDDLILLHGERLPHGLLRLMLWTVLRYYLPVKEGSLITMALWTIRRGLKRLLPA